MVTYVEFRPHQRKHKGAVTPTGEEEYDGVQDFINFLKERDLSLLVTDSGEVYGLGDSILASLCGAEDSDVDRIEKELKNKLHWPVLALGYDPRVELRTVRRFLRHAGNSILYALRIKKRRRPHEF